MLWLQGEQNVQPKRNEQGQVNCQSPWTPDQLNKQTTHYVVFVICCLFGNELCCACKGEQNVQPKRNERGQVIRLPKIDFRIRDFLTTDRDIHTFTSYVVCYCRQIYDGQNEYTEWTFNDAMALTLYVFRYFAHQRFWFIMPWLWHHMPISAYGHWYFLVS